MPAKKPAERRHNAKTRDLGAVARLPLAAAVSADALLAYAAPKLNRAQRRARR